MTVPRPAVPLVVLVSSAGLVAGALWVGVRQLASPPAVAVLAMVAAIVPWRSSAPLRGVGVVAAAFAVVASAASLSLPSLAARLVGATDVSPAALVAVVVAGAVRFLSLSTEAVVAWVDDRWRRGITGEPRPIGEALERALRRDSETRDADVDAAVVALAAMRRDEVPVADRRRRGFWIDVYNVLSMHARRDRTSKRFWSFAESYRVRYEVAGSTLSLDEIEHGLLRGNQRHPAFLSFPFGDSDERFDWVVPLDVRIHFMLNCGMRSCPRVRRAGLDDVETCLEDAARSFVPRVTTIDDRARRIESTQIFQFYAGDFGGEAGIRETIARYCDREAGALDGYELRYTPYDFTAELNFA